MINLLRHIFFLKACYLIKLEYQGTTYYPAKVDKTYLPETLNIRISQEKEAYTTDWLFDVLSSSCMNERQGVPELYFNNCRIESAELKDGIFVITLSAYEKHKAGFISYAELAKLDEDPKGPFNEGEDSSTDYDAAFFATGDSE